MKIKLSILFLILLLMQASAHPWGEKGHQLIMRKAVEMLPKEMSFPPFWKEYLAERVGDPDVRLRFDKSEEQKHFIKLDSYNEFLNGEMIFDSRALAELYGEDKLEENGLLPWSTLESFENLVLAFSEMNRDRILIHIADLAHFVADGHQPLHTVMNNDGQLTRQSGLKNRYGTELTERNFAEIDSSVTFIYSGLVYNPMGIISDYLIDSHFKSEMIFAADRAAINQSGSFNDNYYKLLWFRTKNLTVQQFNNASSALASLIYTAWSNAGKPNTNELK